MKAALALFAAAAAVIAAGAGLLARTWHLSYWHGLYCSLGTASTAGCDTSARGPAGWIAASGIILTAVPLLGAAYGSLHTGRIKAHLDRHHHSIRQEIRDAGAPPGPDDGGKDRSA